MIWALALPFAFLYIFYSIWFKRQPVFQRGSQPAEKIPPISQVLENPEKTVYNIRSFSVPKLTGWLFKLLIRISYSRLGQLFVVKPLIHKSNLDCLQGKYIPENPTFRGPTPPLIEDQTHANKELLQKLLQKEIDEEGVFHLPTVAVYVGAFRSGRCTPTEVAEAVLNAIEDSNKANPPLRAIIETSRDVVLAQAKASTQRWKEGKTLSLLDGIPVAVKGEIHVEPYQFLAGASYAPEISKGLPESALVQKLKCSGGVIIGVANLQEFGAGTLGSNPNRNHLTARNPYNPQCYPGGSSSGSAVSVAAGLCPIALGADGGGSVRIPAALCGLVGLKPTNGSLDSTGMFPQTYTVCAPGPLCSSILDTAITMDIFSKETNGEKKLVSLKGLGDRKLDKLKVGIDWRYFEDADREVVSKCKAAVSHLKSLGAEIIDISIPELEEMRIAHALTIVSEFANSLGIDIDKHFDELTLESLLLIGVGFHFTAVEYLNAQKQRTRAIEAMKYFFYKLDCDVIVTPATAIPAPEIPPGALSYGISDSENSTALMRFSFLANLTGLPGLVVPVGYTSGGLPISLQVMGQWYQEGMLLKIGYALEKTGAFPTKKPRVFYDVIKTASTTSSGE